MLSEAGGWTDWVAGLPDEVRTHLPDGTRLLGVHAVPPGFDDGPGINPLDDDASGDPTRRLPGRRRVRRPHSPAGRPERHVRVDYDHDAVIAMLEALGHPGRAWLIAHQRGEVS